MVGHHSEIVPHCREQRLRPGKTIQWRELSWSISPGDLLVHQPPSQGRVSSQGVKMVDQVHVVLVVEDVTGETLLLFEIEQQQFHKI